MFHPFSGHDVVCRAQWLPGGFSWSPQATPARRSTNHQSAKWNPGTSNRVGFQSGGRMVWSKHGFNFSAPNPNTPWKVSGVLDVETPGIHVLASWAKVCYPRSIPILACKTMWALAGSVSCKPPATPTSPWQRIARDIHDIGCRLVMNCNDLYTETIRNYYNSKWI